MGQRSASVDSKSWWRSVLVGDGGRLVDRAEPGADAYIVLPRRSRPRAVIDRDAPAGLANFLERAATQRRLPASIGSIMAASRVVPLVAPTWAVVADEGVATLRLHLSEVVGDDVRLAIVVGPPRMNRKPVVRCYRDDDLAAVAKLGPDPHTAAMVENEASWLERLAGEPVEGLRTPELLHRGRFGDSALLVMSVLPLVSDAGIAFDRMPTELLDRFTTRYRTDATVEESPWFVDLPSRAASGGDEVLSAARAAFGRDDVALDLEAWHGDWSPWNLGQTATGEWCLWDWERAGTDVPRGFDAVHRQFHYGAGLAGARAELRAMGLADAPLERTLGLYLLELATRMVEAGAWSTGIDNEVRNELGAALERTGVRIEGPA